VTGVLEERVEELRTSRTHGGSWLARRAVETLAELASEGAATSDELLERLVGAGRELAASRPGVAAVAGAVGRLLAAADGQRHLAPDDLRRLVEDEARGLIDARDRAARAIAIQLRPRLEDALVLTHSASATVREAFLHSPPARVTCTVTAPYEEGRTFAEDLTSAGLTVDLIEDEEAADALRDVSLVLLGADTVYRDGVLCNKIGTSRIAGAACELNVPTVVACEVIKFAPADAPDRLDAELERMLDLTPPEHVDEYVTEEGAYTSDGVRSLVDRTPFLSRGYALLRSQ
jgi:translation initiation factor 2B subunit (eIF-2B alpha/beta/delta family)